jgi:hypothetical protein
LRKTKEQNGWYGGASTNTQRKNCERGKEGEKRKSEESCRRKKRMKKEKESR